MQVLDFPATVILWFVILGAANSAHGAAPVVLILVCLLQMHSQDVSANSDPQTNDDKAVGASATSAYFNVVISVQTRWVIDDNVIHITVAYLGGPYACVYAFQGEKKMKREICIESTIRGREYVKLYKKYVGYTFPPCIFLNDL